MQQIINLFLLKTSGVFWISWFLSTSILLPAVNIIRSIFLIPMNLKIFYFFLFHMFLLYVVFVLSPGFYYKTVLYIFNINIIKRKNFFFFGPRLLRDYPLLFGCYLCLSISSLYLVRENPNNLSIHLFYVLCVWFRNLFIAPCAGFSSIIAVNKKKLELFKKMNSYYQQKAALFESTPLENNKIFCKKIEILTMVVTNLKPSTSSVKKTTFISSSTSIIWFSSVYIKIKAESLCKAVIGNKEKLQKNISDFLEEKNQGILTQLAVILDEKMKFLSNELIPYINMNSIQFSIHFIWNKEKFLKILNSSFDLVTDSIILKFCSEIDNQKVQHDLLYLAQKHKPELVPVLEKKFSNLEKKSPENFTFSCRESIDFGKVSLKKLLDFLF